jgi:hypothetical protein
VAFVKTLSTITKHTSSKKEERKKKGDGEVGVRLKDAKFAKCDSNENTEESSESREKSGKNRQGRLERLAARKARAAKEAVKLQSRTCRCAYRHMITEGIRGDGTHHLTQPYCQQDDPNHPAFAVCTALLATVLQYYPNHCLAVLLPCL